MRFEVVAVDHASRDGTAKLLSRFAARDARVRVEQVSDARTLAEALEHGRRSCAAPLVARMDADDVMHPLRLAADLAWLQARPHLAAVACQVKLIPRGRTTAGWRAYVAWQNAVHDSAAHAREVWVEQPLCHPATTFRRVALDAVGGYRDAVCPEDYDLFMRLLLSGQAVEKRPAVHHAWRQHARSSTRWGRDAFALRKAQAMVDHLGARDRPIVIAGAGKEGGRMGRALRAEGVAPAAYLDIAARRIGRTRHGALVRPASDLPLLLRELPDVLVVAAVGTSGSRGVVRGQLRAAGLVEGENCVVVT